MKPSRAAALLLAGACGGGPRPVAPETRELLARHADPATWEALGAETELGWPRRARDPRTGIEFVLVPPGEFWMGEGDSGQEGPRHRVQLTRPYYLGATEVTAAQWRRCVDQHGGDPAVPAGDGPGDRAAAFVSWQDAQAFCAVYGYELPTEAQWEHACYAGEREDTAWWRDPARLDEHAWSSTNSGGDAHAVATRAPNPLGLHDMLGGVWEWCREPWRSGYRLDDPQALLTDPPGPATGDLRVLRGGSWFTAPPPRPFDRTADRASARTEFYGLRVCVTLEAR